MDKGSRYLLLGLVLLGIAVTVWGYRVFFIEQNFVVKNVTECDPQVEICFMWCEEECEEDYYKKIVKNAKNIPDCDSSVEECEPLVCSPEEMGCEVIYCSSDTVEEGEQCTNPLDFEREEEETESTGVEIDAEASMNSE